MTNRENAQAGAGEGARVTPWDGFDPHEEYSDFEATVTFEGSLKLRLKREKAAKWLKLLAKPKMSHSGHGKK